jgi:hypothetical protein
MKAIHLNKWIVTLWTLSGLLSASDLYLALHSAHGNITQPNSAILTAVSRLLLAVGLVILFSPVRRRPLIAAAVVFLSLAIIGMMVTFVNPKPRLDYVIPLWQLSDGRVLTRPPNAPAVSPAVSESLPRVCHTPSSRTSNTATASQDPPPSRPTHTNAPKFSDTLAAHAHIQRT